MHMDLMHGARRAAKGRRMVQSSASALIVAAGLAAASPAAAQVVDEVEEIVVTGQRASDRESLARKRDADTAVEVVSANDVGKLPDQNVAEAVNRLSGVSVATDKGEGRYLVIRGIEPSLANVTINNQTAAAPEPESRQVKLDDIPSALIGSVTVIKSLTPDLDANAIAGQVDINTLSAFDKGRTIASARVVSGSYELTDERPIEGDVAFGGLFGPEREFGLVVAANYSKRPMFSENIIATGDSAWQVVNGIELPSYLDSRIYDPITRTRKGAVANFDWRPSDAVKAYAKFMYAYYDDSETRNRFRFLFPGNASQYSSLTPTGGAIAGTRGERYVRRRQETTETTTFSLGGDFEIGAGTLTAQYTYSLADKTDPIRDEFRYRTGSTAVSGSFDLTDRLFRLTPAASALDPARYNLDQYVARFGSAEEVLNQFRVDYRLPIEAWGEGSYLKFGAKYLNREKSNDGGGRTYGYSGPARTLANDTEVSVPSSYDGRYAFGPFVSYASARAFFEANRALFPVNRASSISNELGADYEVSETILAGYGMANLKFGRLTVIPGVRVEKTEGDFKAYAITATSDFNDRFNSFGSQSYTDWFPGVNARFDVNSQLVARAAVTTAIGRPNYVDIAPTVVVDLGNNTVSQGNPTLEPLKAVNFDASLEYYFPGEGGISVGVFHKRIDNPIFSSTRVASGVFGGVPLTNATITEPRNAERAEITGLEFNFQKPFTFLPEPFDGFGLNFNVTFVTGDTKVPGRSDKVPLILQSDIVSSTQLYYEKGPFQARLAYSWRSEYLELVGDSEDDDIYWGSQGSLSARVGYSVTKEIQVFAEASNWDDVYDYRYAGREDRFVEAERYGRTIRFGVSYAR